MKFSIRVFRSVAAMLLLLGLLSVPASAQTSLTSTTLAASITDTSSKVVSLTSASGFTASTTTTQAYILVDRELMYLQSVNGTNATVIRGFGSTRAQAHFAGVTAYYVPVASTLAYVPSGYCVRTNLAYVPVVVMDGQDETNNGLTLDCLGSQWVQTNKIGVPVFGATVASASSITATGTYFKVSGTTAVNTITVPAGWASGMSLIVEPLALGSTGTSGNILLGSTFVVGKALILTWNGTKWVPSY